MMIFIKVYLHVNDQILKLKFSWPNVAHR